mgnify:CR=1 FL=1
MYLLVFDRGLAEEAVKGTIRRKGPHFAERSTRREFRTTTNQTDLNDTSSRIDKQIVAPDDRNRTFHECVYDVTIACHDALRHMARFQNAISVVAPRRRRSVPNWISLPLEMLRLYDLQLFKGNSSQANFPVYMVAAER